MQNLLSCLINHLDIDKLLQPAVEGPNVNWLVLGMLEDKFEAGNFTSTLHISVQHIHGAQKEGIHKTAWNLDKQLKLLFWLFNDSPARQEAYLVERDTDKCPRWFACCCTIVVDSKPSKGHKCGSY